MENKLIDLNFMSLFDGVGGFPIAWANVNKIDYKNLEYISSEVEPFLTNIIENNFPKSKQLFDITKIKDEELLKLSPDVITMGTPCTGFSISGKREGLANEQSQLFNIGIDIIEKTKPKYFIWENVFGVISANNGSEFKEIMDCFKNIGYDTSWTLLDSKFFNIPQRRRRLFVIGVRDGIKKDNNIYDFYERTKEELIKESKSVDSFFEFDLNPNSKNPKEHYAFFNKQRSDKLKEIGISNTLAKRDYKSSTDLVVKDGSVRRIVPKERLGLQGIPDYWFDCTYEQKSDINRFKANGMSIPVVEYVFENLRRIEDGTAYINPKEYKKEILSSTTAHLIGSNEKFPNKYKKLSNSGFMYLERNDDGSIKSNTAEYHLIFKSSESSSEIKLKKIKDILLDEVDEKFHLKKGGLAGFLKREISSGNKLPEKLKSVILHKHPDLYKKYYDKS